jgi:hypothetical protein
MRSRCDALSPNGNCPRKGASHAWIRKLIMDESLRRIVGVLAVAMIVALAARRFNLPYTKSH